MPKIIVTLTVTHQKHICILIFLYNASHNEINITIIYIHMDPELFVISVTVYVTNQHEVRYDIQHH